MEVVDKYKTEQEFHRKLLSQSMSGARLKVAFGGYWFEQIWWDNANPNIADYLNGRLDPSVPHIERVVMEQKPTLIITFGRQAEIGLSMSVASIKIKVMSCHHPNARYKTQVDLDNFAQTVIQEAIMQEQKERDNES